MVDAILVFWVAALAAGVYWGSLHNEISFDDHPVLGALHPFKDAQKRSTWNNLLHLPKFGRSLLYWTYFRDLAEHGIEGDATRTERQRVVGWHATNLALHALCGALLYALLRYWFPPWQAVLGASFASLHPIGSSSVPSISGRSSLLCGVFFYATALVFLCGPWAWPLMLPLAWFGWRSKEEYAAIAPTLLVMWWFR